MEEEKIARKPLYLLDFFAVVKKIDE